MIKASVLVAVYNKENIVKKTLEALACQSCRCFEIIVCDDGSNESMGKMLDEMQPVFQDRLKRVWHADKGFRKCKILNSGVLLAQSDYIIVLDPDCLPHHHFVRAHLEERQKGKYLSGRRVELGPGITRLLLDNAMPIKHLTNPVTFLWQIVKYRKNRHLEAGVYLPRILRALMKKSSLDLKGCNMSFWKKDIKAINGFEELFELPTCGEDTDLERRFKLSGLKSRSVKHGAVCYHLNHKRLPRNPVVETLYSNLKKTGSSLAVKGLCQRDRSL